jgi:glutathione S-transferase
MISEALPILYTFRRCPYAMRTRMALLYSGIPVEIREVKLSNKPKSLLEISPKGTVPVLVLKDKVIDESLEIIKYALSVNDPKSWIPKNKEIPWKMIETVNKNGELNELISKYKYFEKYPEKSQQEHREALEESLQSFETLLNKTNFLISDEITIVDICLFPFIRQLAKVDRKWFSKTFLKMDSWLAFFENSELFNNVMKNYKPWKEFDEIIILK